jgi:VanZ family protein
MPLHAIHRLQRWGAGHPFLFYTLPLVCWVLFVSWGCLAPPSDLPQFQFALADKLEHASIYVILAILMLRAWARQRRATWPAGLIVMLIAAGWGLYLEFLQRASGYRSFDLWDAACNALGAMLGVTLWLGVAVRLAPPAVPPFPSPIPHESKETAS